jgi:hypothetical protein
MIPAPVRWIIPVLLHRETLIQKICSESSCSWELGSYTSKYRCGVHQRRGSGLPASEIQLTLDITYLLVTFDDPQLFLHSADAKMKVSGLVKPPVNWQYLDIDGVFDSLQRLFHSGSKMHPLGTQEHFTPDPSRHCFFYNSRSKYCRRVNARHS